MLRHQIGMIVVHEHLGIPDTLHHVPVQPDFPVRAQVRNIRENVDHHRNQDEKHHAPQKRRDHAAGELNCQIRALLRRMPLRKPVLVIQGQDPAEKQHGQANGPIAANPLGGDGHSHEQAGQGQLRQEFGHGCPPKIPPHPPDHEQEHQHHEQDRERVNGGNPGLRKVHAVKGQQALGQARPPGTAQNLQGQQIDHRQHQDTCQRAGKAPGKGGHPHGPDAEAHEHFSQRRMRRLIRGQTVGMLIPGPRMIDLIKVHAVLVRRLQGHRVRLINEGVRIRRPALPGAGDRSPNGRQNLAVFIHGRHLPQGGACAVKYQFNVSSGEGEHIAAGARGPPIFIQGRPAHGLPLEALAPVKIGHDPFFRRHFVR